MDRIDQWITREAEDDERDVCEDCGSHITIEHIVYEDDERKRMWLCFRCRQARQLDGQRVSYA